MGKSSETEVGGNESDHVFYGGKSYWILLYSFCDQRPLYIKCYIYFSLNIGVGLS
ncbi:hypothetical protein SAMN04488028_101268 [Reichenbachiella agariperforans]|uniref:Uncharacterized protein n=1 Tax=Reichenbachiella agariperforans TaxID=156994 RepID=A0A1M6JPD7_REIAG|nr:hypothetical protein SAMN04488028_101268 [Reichenbachiella agariperforans]